MMRSLVIAILLGVATALVGGTESPARARLEQDGWTIGFAPDDRALGEAVAAHLGAFEELFATDAPARTGFGPAELEARAAEAAARVAEWCALPGRIADFEQAFRMAAARVTEIQSDARAALQIRTIELWRATDIRELLATGEPMPGARWIEDTKSLNMLVTMHLEPHLLESRVTLSVTAPPAVMLQVPEGVEQASALGTLIADFSEWANIIGGSDLVPEPITLHMASHLGIARVLESEIASDRSARWIIEGVSAWLWRELVFGTLKPEGAHRYAPVVPVLLVPHAGGEPFDLERWSEVEEMDNLNRARQVFWNIEQCHGKEAVARVLAEFWKLPLEKRMTSELKGIYRELMDEPLEARAPWRSLGPIPRLSAGTEHRTD